MDKRGGMGLPDLKQYYDTANLVNIIKMLDSKDNLDWMNIELSTSRYLNIGEIIWQTSNCRKSFVQQNVFFHTTLKIWDK